MLQIQHSEKTATTGGIWRLHKKADLKMRTAPLRSDRKSAGDRQTTADVLKGDGSNGDEWPEEAPRLSSPTDRLWCTVSGLLTSVKLHGFFFMYLKITHEHLQATNHSLDM